VSIAVLKRLVVPPSSPLEVPLSPPWDNLEQTIGTPLPNDFKACVETFGSGSFDNFLWVLNPFSANPHLRLADQIKRTLGALRELKSDDPEELPYSLFPEDEGLLPWGMTDNGDGLYWHTGGDTSRWTVVVNAARDPECEEFPLGLTDFLVQILSKKVRSDIFPGDFPHTNPAFHPRT